MSEDIVTRLHKCAEWHKGTSADCEEWLDAATEITRLREENARLKEEVERQRARVNIWVNRAHELGHGESFD
jgi:hypothetical protein